MNRMHVKSSNIKSIGYEESIKTLEIEFKNGSVYQYSRVPEDIYRKLINAPSHGKYFLRFIRDKFPTERMIKAGSVQKS